MSDYASIVSTEWLADHLNAPDLRVVDASWYLPDENRDALSEYNETHIPGAVFFDLSDMSDDESQYPNMLPPPPKFSSRVRKLGLGDGNRIVIYDGAGLFSAARAWWMFKVMGYHDVAVLDGGLPKWKLENRELTDMPTRSTERHFTPRVNRMILREVDEVTAAMNTGKEQIVDARSPERYGGLSPEPRPDVRAGHIPGALNLPYKNLLNADGTLLPAAALAKQFEEIGADLSKPIICSCGSGVTAAILYLALDVIGQRNISVYDGSWAEWGTREDLPVEVDK